MKRLSGKEAVQFEEHFFACAKCIDKAERTATFVYPMQSASAKFGQTQAMAATN